MHSQRGSTFFLSFLALIAFAGNSVLCRLALADNAIDATLFTMIRMVSGALTLLLIYWFTKPGKEPVIPSGSWYGALFLFAYAACFSYAYTELDTAIGALILFTAVQASMIGLSIIKGNHLSALEWLGVTISFGGFLYLILPEITSPPIIAATLMIIAGCAWGAYSVVGQSSSRPLLMTTGNFVRCTPLLLLLTPMLLTEGTPSSSGIIYALLSGIICSAIGYTIWYSVLPRIRSNLAAISQLSVPIFAAIGGVIFANELLSISLVIAGTLILCGILLTLIATKR